MNEYIECIDFLWTRRSIREYIDKDVPMELIMKILDIAHYAP